MLGFYLQKSDTELDNEPAKPNASNLAKHDAPVAGVYSEQSQLATKVDEAKEYFIEPVTEYQENQVEAEPYYEDSLATTPESIEKTEEVAFTKTFDDGNNDFGNIDQEMIGSGEMFKADLNRLKNLSQGQQVTIDLLNKNMVGKVEIKQSTKIGSTMLSVKLDDSSVSNMSIYYGETLTRGKIYTPDGSYIFEANINVGFLMNMHEYKKMKNALYID